MKVFSLYTGHGTFEIDGALDLKYHNYTLGYCSHPCKINKAKGSVSGGPSLCLHGFFSLLSFELFCRIGRSRSLVSTRTQWKKLIASYGFVENDCDLVHGLLEVKDALLGSSRTEKILQSVWVWLSDIASSVQAKESIRYDAKWILFYRWSSINKRDVVLHKNDALDMVQY